MNQFRDKLSANGHCKGFSLSVAGSHWKYAIPTHLSMYDAPSPQRLCVTHMGIHITSSSCTSQTRSIKISNERIVFKKPSIHFVCLKCLNCPSDVQKLMMQIVQRFAKSNPSVSGRTDFTQFRGLQPTFNFCPISIDSFLADRGKMEL